VKTLTLLLSGLLVLAGCSSSPSSKTSSSGGSGTNAGSSGSGSGSSSSGSSGARQNTTCTVTITGDQASGFGTFTGQGSADLGLSNFDASGFQTGGIGCVGSAPNADGGMYQFFWLSSSNPPFVPYMLSYPPLVSTIPFTTVMDPSSFPSTLTYPSGGVTFGDGVGFGWTCGTRYTNDGGAVGTFSFSLTYVQIIPYNDGSGGALANANAKGHAVCNDPTGKTPGSVTIDVIWTTL